MKIIVLGKGLAGTVFHVVSNYLLEGENEVVVYYLASLPMQQKGLRYLHPPTDREKELSKITKNAARHMWSYMERELGLDYYGITKQLNWAVMEPGGKLFSINGNMDNFMANDLTRDYAELHWREHEPNIMNSVLMGNRHPLASCINYNEFVAKLDEQSELFDSVNKQLVQSQVMGIDLNEKRINTSDGGDHRRSESYDVLINTIPLPHFVRLIEDFDVSKDTFKYSPAIYVTSNTVVDTRLDYYYNIWPIEDQDYYQLSRVVFKKDGTDFEFSVNPKYADTTTPTLDTSEIIQATIYKHLRILNRTFNCKLSWKNFEDPVANKYAHFHYSFDIRDLIESLEESDIYQLGRYAQWHHGVKLNEIWSRAVDLCDSLGEHRTCEVVCDAEKS